MPAIARDGSNPTKVGVDPTVLSRRAIWRHAERITRQTQRFSSHHLGSLVANHVAQGEGFASDFCDAETPRNPGDVSKSQNLRLLRRMAFTDAAAASTIQMALRDTTVGSTPTSRAHGGAGPAPRPPGEVPRRPGAREQGRALAPEEQDQGDAARDADGVRPGRLPRAGAAGPRPADRPEGDAGGNSLLGHLLSALGEEKPRTRNLEVAANPSEEWTSAQVIIHVERQAAGPR